MKRNIALLLVFSNVIALLLIINGLQMATYPFRPCGYCEPEERATYDLRMALSFGLGVALVLGVPYLLVIFEPKIEETIRK